MYACDGVGRVSRELSFYSRIIPYIYNICYQYYILSSI